ncbi:MAG: ATP-binding protein [Desulfomonilaceae bacterium]
MRFVILVLALLSLVSMSAGGYLYYEAARQSALKEAEGESITRTRLLQQRIQELITFHHKDLHALSRFEEFRDIFLNPNEKSLAEANRVLDHFAEGLNFDVCFLLDGTGTAIASSNRNTPQSFVGHDYSFRPYFTSAIKGKPDTHMALGLVTHRVGLFLSHPVYAPGVIEPVGVVAAKVSLDSLEHILRLFDGTIVLLVHDTGIITFSLGRDWVLHSLWKIPSRDLSAIVRTKQFGTGPWPWTGLEETGTNRVIDGSGEPYVLNKRDLENCHGWSIVCLQRVNTLFPKIVDPLAGQSGYTALALFVLLGGTVTFFFFVAERDLRARKSAEQGLQESEAKYRVLFESGTEGFLLLDNVFEECNEQVCRIWRCSEDDILGHEPAEFWPDIQPDGRNSVKAFQIYSGAATEGSPQRFYWKTRRKDGVLIDTEISLKALLLAQRQILLATVTDITERKMAEEEKKLLREQLFQAQKMEAVGTLAGGIAHDFNNLLQAISGYTELLLMKKEPGDPDRKKLEIIQQAARDGADLVSRILAFSKKSESKVRPIDLNQELLRIERLLRRTLPLMIKIDLVLSDDLKIINADPAQVEQLILNLGVNAQHAMPDGGQLLIETSNVSISDEYLRTHLGARPGKYVLLSVSDTGLGMASEVLERIFEPFFTTKTHAGGTGLGLSMVLGIVTQHGGYIRCYSEPGRGTSFKIYLPVSTTEGLWELAETREMPAFGTETILVVDDDDRVRDMAQQMIKTGGYQVLTARSGEEALEIYAGHREEIALVILDLIMPGMGGKRCLEDLLRIDPDSRVIIASGLSSNGLALDEKGTGARGFIMKPYDAKDILRAIRKVLDTGHM